MVTKGNTSSEEQLQSWSANGLLLGAQTTHQAGSPDCLEVSASVPHHESTQDGEGQLHGRMGRGQNYGVTGTAGLAPLRISFNLHNCSRKVDTLFSHLVDGEMRLSEGKELAPLGSPGSVIDSHHLSNSTRLWICQPLGTHIPWLGAKLHSGGCVVVSKGQRIWKNILDTE